MLPISIVEREGFREYIHYIDPSLNIPSRSKIRETEFSKLRVKVESKINQILSTMDSVNISLDGWLDPVTRCFNGYVCQGIDHEWKMQIIPAGFEYDTGKSVTFQM